jgi:glycosyltransferase 2 family protein
VNALAPHLDLWRARVERWLPLIKAVGFVVAIGVVVVMGVIAVRDVPLDTLTWWAMAPAVALAALWWWLLAWGWSILAQGHHVAGEISMWCRTQALRYLPGGVWAPASRAVATKGAALDRIGTVVAENGIQLCAALAVGGVALTAGGSPLYLPLILLLVLPLLAVRIAGTRTRVDATRANRSLATYVAGFVAYGASAAAAQAAVSGLHAPLTVAGASLVAWGAGLVVIITPGGVGVREVVYVALLSHHATRSQLLAGAVTARVVTIVAELALLVTLGRPRTGGMQDFASIRGTKDSI